MARTFAVIPLSLKRDEAFTSLTGNAQRLYFDLATTASLNQCGIADWRPKKLAKSCSNWTVDTVLAAGVELMDALLIFVDDETEEVLIRRHMDDDGVLKMPNMAVALCGVFGDIASKTLRGLVVHELHRIHERSPELAAWTGKASAEPLAELLRLGSVNPSESGLRIPFENPSGNPSPNPYGMGEHPAPIPSPSPSPSRPTDGAAAEATAPAPSPKRAKAPNAPKPKTVEDEQGHAVADALWDHSNGLIKFVSVRAMAVRAIKSGHTVEQVTAAMTELYDAGRPITLELIGQTLTGRTRATGGRPGVGPRFHDDRSAPKDVAPPAYDPAAEALRRAGEDQ